MWSLPGHIARCIFNFCDLFQDTLRDVFLTSTISEWLLAISIILFLLTFIPGFKKMEFDGIVTKWKAPGSEKSVSNYSTDNQTEAVFTSNLQTKTNTLFILKFINTLFPIDNAPIFT